MRSYADCHCECHHTPGMLHAVACCDQSYRQREVLTPFQEVVVASGRTVLVWPPSKSGAVFVDGRRHRLYLWRRWDPTGTMAMFIGLNPSTANEEQNDPTVRRCIEFAKRWGYGGMFMCNAFTLVSTDPKGLEADPEPLLRGANLALRVLRQRSAVAVAAWGNLIEKVRAGKAQTERLRRELAPLHCFGTTKLGHPRHPLYLAYSTELVPLEDGGQ